MTTERKQTAAQTLMPPPEAFEGAHVVTSSIISKGYKYPVYESTDYPPEGGIYVHYKGMPFPKKGMPFPQAVWMNDIAKRITMSMIKSIAHPAMVLPILVFSIMPWTLKKKAIENALGHYIRTCNWILDSYVLKEDRYSNPCRSIRKMTIYFFESLGMTNLTAINMAKIFATLIEYDDAYRYRIEDIMSETTQEALTTRPLREVRRIFDIFLSRETYRAVHATGKVLKIAITIALIHPKIRSAFKIAFGSLHKDEFEKLQLDNADRYHILLRGDYNFTGRSFEERRRIFIDFHTHSKCCDVGVVEKKLTDKSWQTSCTKCGEKCEYYQDFPPEVEIASIQQ